MPVATIVWEGGRPGHVRMIDQTLLPTQYVVLDVRTVEHMFDGIRRLAVRGAPAIGVAAGFGLLLGVQHLDERDPDDVLGRVRETAAYLAKARPTAVNLFWALERMLARATRDHAARRAIVDGLFEEARAIFDEDCAICRKIGEVGAALVRDGATLLTHCNAGGLATADFGTALAPIYAATAQGKRVAVFADETRPLLQGSRLTAWELSRAGVPTTVIADNMAASRLRRGDVTCVIVGADRIAANGDVANKIGTYPLALAARAHAVPFYVAAPRSTFDFATPDGAAIPIEERHADEVRHPGGTPRPTAPAAAGVWNPAFDVTPAPLVSGYLTDAGLLDRESLARLRD